MVRYDVFVGAWTTPPGRVIGKAAPLEQLRLPEGAGGPDVNNNERVEAAGREIVYVPWEESA